MCCPLELCEALGCLCPLMHLHSAGTCIQPQNIPILMINAVTVTPLFSKQCHQGGGEGWLSVYKFFSVVLTGLPEEISGYAHVKQHCSLWCQAFSLSSGLAKLAGDAKCSLYPCHPACWTTCVLFLLLSLRLSDFFGFLGVLGQYASDSNARRWLDMSV